MNIRIRYGTAFVLGILSLTLSQLAWSLGLGDAKVDSFLDQPLSVKIELISQASDDLGSVRAGLAAAEDYELIGASRDDISVPLSFSVVGSPGEAFIQVNSELPVKSPVVRLILEVNWASGRMLREYTLFLDPATFSQPAPAPTPRKKATPSQPQTAAPAAESQTSPEPSRPQTSPASQDTEGDSGFTGANEYGPVQSGETLWRIAKDWSDGTGLNINKVMLAIQRNNPQAFSRNNINLLQRGAILRMPDRAEVNAMSVADANDSVREQEDAFKMRRTVTSAATPLLVDENTAPQAAQEVQSPSPTPEESSAPDEAAPEEAVDAAPLASDSLEPEPQLELVPPSLDEELETAVGFEESAEDSEAVGSVQTLREELARKEEELINQQQQNAYLEQRLKELEEQVAETPAGTVDDANLSNMEDRLQEERLAESAEKDKPWYGSMMWLLIALLVIVALVAGWFMSRRGGSAEADSTGEVLSGIKDEAEDVLRVLDSDEPDEPETEPTEEIAPDDDADATVVTPAPEASTKKLPVTEDDAEVLDEESADPEIQLDLARAYISMGDKEAARVILEEVMANGSEDQQAEAIKMKDFL